MPVSELLAPARRAAGNVNAARRSVEKGCLANCASRTRCIGKPKPLLRRLYFASKPANHTGLHWIM
jgi:hypothetical protein